MKVINGDLNSNSSQVVLDIVQSENLQSYRASSSDHESKDGYVGLPYQLTIEGTTSEGKSKVFRLFVKTASKLDQIRKGFPVNFVFKREKFLYMVVFEEFKKFENRKGIKRPFTQSIARCFLAKDTDMDEFVVMEDLSKSGYLMWNKEKMMDKDHLEIVVKELARLHALSFAYRDQFPDKFKVLEKGATEFIKGLYEFTKFNDVLEDKCRKAVDYFDLKEEPDVYKRYKKFAFEEAKNWLINFFDPEPSELVILHGDCWSNNFMFFYKDEKRDKPEKVAIIDWQLSRLGSPAIDLSYFLFTACSKEQFQNMQNYLNIYHESLSSYMEELGSDARSIFPFSALERHWKEYAKFGLILSTVVIHSLVLKTKEEVPSLLEFAEQKRNLADMFLFEKASKESNQLYKERIRNVIKYCVESNII